MDKDELSQKLVEASPSEWPGAWPVLSVPQEKLPDRVRSVVNARIQQAIREKRRKRLWITGGIGGSVLAAAAALFFYIWIGRPAPSGPMPLSAVVLFAAGDVHTERRGLATGDIIKDGETLSVGAGSVCDLQIRESESTTLLRVRGGTQLSFAGIRTQGRPRVSVKINSGNVTARVNRLSPHEAIQFHTPTTVASVRGTKLEIDVSPDGTVKTTVYEGNVHLRIRLPEIDDLPSDLLSTSEKLSSVAAAVEAAGISVRPGQSASLSPDAANMLGTTTAVKIIIEQPEVKQLRGKTQPSKADVDKAAKSLDEALQSTAVEALVLSVNQSMQQRTQRITINPSESAAKLKEIDELLEIEIGRLRDELRAAEAVKERNQKLREVLMARIEEVLGKPAETVVLTDGTKLRGVVVRVGDAYHVINAEGRKEVPVGQVDRIEFE